MKVNKNFLKVGLTQPDTAVFVLESFMPIDT